MEREQPQAHGLKRRKRANGAYAWVWCADPRAIKAGYPVKTVNLTALAHQPDLMVKRAERLQLEMNLWLRQSKMPQRKFDATFKFLLEQYQSDQQSPFNISIKPGTRRVYTTYLRKLINHIGGLSIAGCDGRDVMEWFSEWRVGASGRDQLPAARTALAVLESAVSFGIVCRLDGVRDFKDVLSELSFETPKPRKYAPTAAQVIAARKAAHANGAPSRALVYALQFETTARQWDWIGRWVPLSDLRVSDITSAGMKWIGPRWSDIDKDLILSIKPTKTEDTTEVEIAYDLAVCPMVMAELALIPEEKRSGPLVINPNTGLPYREEAFREGWRKDYALAGIPKQIWNRDTRAGGITEGKLSGASRDDRRRLAGHSKEEQTDDYERLTVDLDAHRKVMAARKRFREQNN
jgi:hypothetical protein